MVFTLKTPGELIDELSITNIKCAFLVDKIQKNQHSKEEAKKLQDLNRYRSQLRNDIDELFGNVGTDRKDMKV